MAGWMQAGSVVPARTPATPAFTPVGASTQGGGGARARPPPLPLYAELPSGEVSIEEFERLSLDRIRVLKGLEDAKAKGLRQDELEKKAQELMDRHLGAPSTAEAARRDLVSHHLLRLAYCRTEELRRWFLGLETELFRLRFRVLLPHEQRAVAEAARLPYSPLSRGEFAEVEGDLRQAMAGAGAPPPAVAQAFSSASPHEGWYRAPFEAVPDLVASRRAYLRLGEAFVPREALASLLLAPFRANLSKALAVTSRRWNSFLGASERDRLAPIVEGVSKRYLGRDYSDPRARGAGAVLADDIPRLDAESFPLCMHSMYQALHRDHALRHDGRMQLGLFLKGIGLPLEEAVRFWQVEMAPATSTEKFQKEYLYNVRHNYGKEGNRKDYTPYTCAKIVSTVPGAGQVHGCPYRTFGTDRLRDALDRLGVSPAARDTALDKARGGHYQLACAAAWEGKHGCQCEAGINHPNQYYEESRAALDGEEHSQAATPAGARFSGATGGRGPPGATPPTGGRPGAPGAPLGRGPSPTPEARNLAAVLSRADDGRATKVRKEG